MAGTTRATIRAWSGFALLPALFSLILYWLYRSPAFGERADPVAWVLLVIFPAGAIWLGRPGAEGALARLQVPITRHGRRNLAAFAILALGFYLAVARMVLDAFPNSGDELAYVMQAETYARGRLWLDLPAVSEAFMTERFFDIGGHWMSQYPPGWAAVLAPAVALGVPLWIINPIVGATMLVVFYVLARRYAPPQVAWTSVLLLGLSAFYVLNAGSFFNHGLTALFGLAFALFGERFLDRGRRLDALLAGVCIGLVGVTRTQSAAPLLLAFSFMTVVTPGRRSGLVWCGLAGAPFLAALLGYNVLTTGGTPTPPQNMSGSEPLGAVNFESLRLTLSRLARLHEWGSPILLYGSVAGLLVLAYRRSFGLTDWIAPLTFLMFLAYGGDGGDQYGPRYYFEAWPFAILTLVKVTNGLRNSADSRVRAWTASATLAALAFQIAYLPPRLEREHRVIVERQAAYAAVEAAGLKRAIVVLDGEVGDIRPMHAADLVRNGLDVGSRGVIYARAIEGRDGDLLRAYPGRSFYTYRNGRLEPRDLTAAQ